MITVILVVLIFVAGLLTAYAQRFQRATLALGSELAPHLPTGLQDAITPKAQTLRSILMFTSIVMVLVYGVVFYPWYFGIAFGLGTVFLVSPILSQFLPKVGSDYYRHRVRKDLVNRRAKYGKAGDTVRLNAVAHILRCLDNEEPIAMNTTAGVVKEAVAGRLTEGNK